VRRAVVLLVAALSCRGEAPQTTHLAATPEPAAPVEPARWIIEEAERDPDAVLVVEVSVPGLFESKAYRRPVRRRQVPEDYTPVFELTGETVGGVNILAATGDTLKVEADFGGEGPGGKRIDATRTFSLPWLGEFKGVLVGGGQVHAWFERPAAR